jgi:hypothetical protein
MTRWGALRVVALGTVSTKGFNPQWRNPVGHPGLRIQHDPITP